MKTILETAFCQDFFRFPVDTSVKRQTVNQFEFPAVTLCNKNKVHCGNLRDHIKYLRGVLQENATVDAEGTAERISSLCTMYHIGR